MLCLDGDGKMNYKLAIKTAEEIRKIDSKAARWIAADAIKELMMKNLHRNLHPIKATATGLNPIKRGLEN